MRHQSSLMAVLWLGANVLPRQPSVGHRVGGLQCTSGIAHEAGVYPASSLQFKSGKCTSQGTTHSHVHAVFEAPQVLLAAGAARKGHSSDQGPCTRRPHHCACHRHELACTGSACSIVYSDTCATMCVLTLIGRAMVRCGRGHLRSHRPMQEERMSLMPVTVSGWLVSRMATRQYMRTSPISSSARRGCDTHSTCPHRELKVFGWLCALNVFGYLSHLCRH
jgi:hypothetical protein